MGGVTSSSSSKYSPHRCCSILLCSAAALLLRPTPAKNKSDQPREGLKTAGSSLLSVSHLFLKIFSVHSLHRPDMALFLLNKAMEKSD